MIQITAYNKKGDSLNLSTSKAFALTKVTGLTPPKSNINTSDLATKDGSIFNSSRMQNRNIVLYIYPTADVEATRLSLYKIFQSKKYVKLVLATGSRTAQIEGYVETLEGDLYTNPQLLQISIICPNPYFEKTSADTFNFADQTTEATNNSDFETGALFTLNISGTLGGLTVTNVTTNESFSFVEDMQAGDVISLDTRQGEKGITLTRDGVTTNIINSVATGSVWMQMATGKNTLTLSDQNAGGKVEIIPLYVGV